MPSVNKAKLADAVVDEIRNLVEAGQLKQGDKLPNQHQLAAQLGVSRTVLREAYQQLALLGVIEQRPKKGTIIRDTAPLIFAGETPTSLFKDPQSAADLMAARSIIEVGAVELAVQNATEDQLRDMEALIEDMVGLVESGDVRGYAHKNVAFHFLIARASGNQFVVHLLAAIRGRMEPWMHDAVGRVPGLLERSLSAHRDIYAGIRDRDRGKAVGAMNKHILGLANGISQWQKGALATGITLADD